MMLDKARSSTVLSTCNIEKRKDHPAIQAEVTGRFTLKHQHVKYNEPPVFPAALIFSRISLRTKVR